MRKIFFLITLLLCLNVAGSYAQSWRWAHNSISHNWQPEQMVTATDAMGNVYVAGNSGGTDSILFGAGVVVVDSFGSGADGFLVKYDSSGNVKWARNFRTHGVEFPASISADDSGNVYFAGECTTNVTFCGDTIANNIFLVKLDSNANLIWRRTTPGSFFAYAITDHNGNTYLTGSFTSDTITFGTFNLVNCNPGHNKEDMFLVKYDANGDVAWAEREGGVKDDHAYYATLDASGNVYVAGYYDSSASAFDSYTLPAPLNKNIFVAKFSPEGTVIWARDFDNAGYEYWENSSAICVATDASENVYVTGAFATDSLLLGTHVVHNSTISSSMHYDMYTAKLNSDGLVLWAIGGGGAGDDRGNSVAVDIDDNVWVSGMFYSSMAIGTDTLTNPSPLDPSYIIRLDSATGAVQSAMVFNSGGYNNDIVADKFGNILWAGNYFVSTSFHIGTDSLAVTASTTNIFVAKYNTGETVARSTTGAAIESRHADVNVYPNPASNALCISYTGAADINANAAIVDMTGRIVVGKQIPCNVTTLSTATLPPGVYICRMTIHGETTNRRIVIQKG